MLTYKVKDAAISTVH